VGWDSAVNAFGVATSATPFFAGSPPKASNSRILSKLPFKISRRPFNKSGFEIGSTLTGAARRGVGINTDNLLWLWETSLFSSARFCLAKALSAAFFSAACCPAASSSSADDFKVTSFPSADVPKLTSPIRAQRAAPASKSSCLTADNTDRKFIREPLSPDPAASGALFNSVRA
jgi:hypothetical protein